MSLIVLTMNIGCSPIPRTVLTDWSS